MMSVLTYLKKNVFSIAIIVAVLLAIAIYVGFQYVKPRLNQIYQPNREFDSKENSNNPNNVPNVDVLFFYVEWCPHSRDAKCNAWDDVSEKYHGTIINGSKVFFKFIDCEDESNASLVQEHNITGYPTIKLVKDNGIVEFNANPTKPSLTSFLHSAI